MKCNNCGSENVFSNGIRIKSGMKWKRYRCKNCGKSNLEPVVSPKDVVEYHDGKNKGVLSNSQTDSDVNLMTKPNLTASIEYREDGSVRYSKLLQLTDEDKLSPERVMRIAGFAPSLWKINRIVIEDWNAQKKDNAGQIVQHLVKLDLSPSQTKKITIEDIDNLLKNGIVNPKPVSDNKPSRTITGDSEYVLEIVIPDIHYGRMTLNTSDSFFSKIQRIVKHIKESVKTKNIKEIYLVPLGDNLDSDGMSMKTTGGTQQFSQITPYQMLDGICSVFTFIIDSLLEIAPVNYVFIPGNHDRYSSYAMSKILQSYYRNFGNARFDVSHSSRKFAMLGNTLVGWSHGDISKKRASDWIFSEAKHLIGKASNIEIHLGHYHTMNVYEERGCVIRYLPTISNMSLWEETQGFSSAFVGVVSFVWSKDGLEYEIYSKA